MFAALDWNNNKLQKCVWPTTVHNETQFSFAICVFGSVQEVSDSVDVRHVLDKKGAGTELKIKKHEGGVE